MGCAPLLLVRCLFLVITVSSLHGSVELGRLSCKCSLDGLIYLFLLISENDTFLQEKKL